MPVAGDMLAIQRVDHLLLGHRELQVVGDGLSASPRLPLDRRIEDAVVALLVTALQPERAWQVDQRDPRGRSRLLSRGSRTRTPRGRHTDALSYSVVLLVPARAGDCYASGLSSLA